MLEPARKCGFEMMSENLKNAHKKLQLAKYAAREVEGVENEKTHLRRVKVNVLADALHDATKLISTVICARERLIKVGEGAYICEDCTECYDSAMEDETIQLPTWCQHRDPKTYNRITADLASELTDLETLTAKATELGSGAVGDIRAYLKTWREAVEPNPAAEN